MRTLLQTLGVVSLVVGAIVLILVAVVAWKIRRFFRALADAADGAIGSTPDTIQLEPASEPEWSDEEAAEAQASQLLQRGFLDAGTYTIPAMGDLVMRGFVKPADGSVAALYDHPVAGLIVDLVTRYPDRTSITVSNSPDSGLDAMPGKTRVNLPGTDAAELYERMLSERTPDKAPRRFAASEFARYFESAYAEEMAWRKQRGGPTKDEIRRVAARSGMSVTEDQVDATQQQLRKGR